PQQTADTFDVDSFMKGRQQKPAPPSTVQPSALLGPQDRQTFGGLLSRVQQAPALVSRYAQAAATTPNPSDIGIPSQSMTPQQYQQVAATERARQTYQNKNILGRGAERFQTSIARYVPAVVGNAAKLGSAAGLDTSAIQSYNERQA